MAAPELDHFYGDSLADTAAVCVDAGQYAVSNASIAMELLANRAEGAAE
jgi:hypothetical protein